MRSYEAARTYFSILGFMSWCVIVVGGLVLLMGMGAGSQVSSFGGRSAGLGILGAVPGAITMFLGFLGLVAVQIGRAGVDTAEYTQQMLKIARDQLEVSQRALRQGSEMAQSFAGIAQKEQPSSGQPAAASFADASQEPLPSRTLAPDQSGEAYKAGDAIQYRGKTIEVIKNGFLFGNRVHGDLDAVKAMIDKDDAILPPRSTQMSPAVDQPSVQGAPRLGGATRADGQT